MDEREVRLWIESRMTESQHLAKIRAETCELGLEPEEVFLSQVAFVRSIIRARNCTSVLELGTFMGYSTLAIAEILAESGGGKITTVDINVVQSKSLPKRLADLGSVDVDFCTSDAQSYCVDLRNQKRRFDLILLDVAEGEYNSLYSTCVELLSPSGVLLIDNILMSTESGWHSENNVVASGNGAPPYASMRMLIERFLRDDRVAASILPLGSGLAMLTRVM